MHDPRIDKLANLLLDHSCELKSGEKVLIEGFDLPEHNLLCALVEGAAKRGAIPVVEVKSVEVQRSLYRAATEVSMQLCGTLFPLEVFSIPYPQWGPKANKTHLRTLTRVGGACLPFPPSFLRNKIDVKSLPY